MQQFCPMIVLSKGSRRHKDNINGCGHTDTAHAVLLNHCEALGKNFTGLSLSSSVREREQCHFNTMGLSETFMPAGE